MIRELRKEIAGLTPAQQKLFAQLLHKEGLATPTAPLQAAPLAPQHYPLSFAQERLWFVHQLDPQNPAYNVFTGVKLLGKLDVVALEMSLTKVVERQAALRTIFIQVDGEPRQKIMPSADVVLRQIDLQDFDPTARTREVERLLRAEAQRPFDLLTGPLYRFTLVLLTPQEHLFLLNLHHIISDRWSIDLFLQEVSQLYQQATRGLALELPPLPAHYGDFAQWQRAWLTPAPSHAASPAHDSAPSEEQVDYWQAKLADAPDILELPTDYPRPSQQSSAGRTYQQPLPPELHQALKTLGQTENCTLFMTLLAAVNLLLQAYTGREDILVGSPITGRNRHEVERLIGFFVNVMVVRTDLSGNPSFRELLHRVRTTVLEAFAHQDTPLELLLQTLSFRRRPGYPPLVQVGFSFQNDLATAIDLPGLQIQRLPFKEETSKLDLTFFVEEADGQLVLAIEYATALFRESTIAQMADHFVTLLTNLVHEPDRALADLRPVIQPPTSAPLIDIVEELEARSNLTRNQLLIWVGQKVHPDLPMYNLCCTGTLLGAIEPAAMTQAFQCLVDSVDVLRTVFLEEDGIPQQIVRDHLHFTLPFLDFSGEHDPALALATWLDKARQHPFDLRQCAFDSALIKIHPEKFVWYIHPHHIISDGFSNILLLGYLDQLYQAACAGTLPAKLDLPSFADFAMQEKAQRQSKRFTSAKAYWAAQAAQPPEPLAFYGRTASQKVGPAKRVVYALGQERSARLKGVAEEADIFNGSLDVTFYNIFAAALLTYLYKLTGVTDLAYGAPFHNRRGAAKQTVGLFMQVLPVRVALQEDETFLTLLQKVSAATMQTLRHSHYAVANPVQQRAYEVVLNYHNMATATFNGYPVINEVIHPGYGDESLGVRVLDLNNSGALTLEFDFNCTLFPAERQSQVIQHFIQVIDAFIANCRQPIGQVKLVTPAEEQQFVVAVNQTTRPAPYDKLMSELFEEQVRQTPTAIAATDRATAVTYAELNARANRLAHQLRSSTVRTLTSRCADEDMTRTLASRCADEDMTRTLASRCADEDMTRTLTSRCADEDMTRTLASRCADEGITAESLVAIFAPRSVDFLTAILGIFKAGGAYLPLDLAHPPARLSQIIQQSECRIVLAAAEVVAKLEEALQQIPAAQRPPVVTLEALLHSTAPVTNLAPVATPDNLAYVIYTSGSTGLPKGAMVEQRGMVNHLYAKVYDLALTQQDKIAQTASQCFDISVWQFLAALVVGGSVHIFDNESAHHPGKLLEAVEAQAITILETVPAMMRALLENPLDTAQQGNLTHLRWMIPTGEALAPDLARQWFARYPAIPLLNAYGPTECSDDVAHYPIYQPPAPEVINMPIGKPVINMMLYILDKQGLPAPMGAPGELYVGGVGVGRGYLNDPERTSKAFLTNPFVATPDARLYRTGDLARFLPDGNIEFLGRIDHQVKIRGFRIELGEIEVVLRAHPCVRDAVVTVYEDQRQQKHLVAYYVADSSVRLVTEELRAFLATKLPEYMVPQFFIALAALPLTPNGKIDRRALPAPEQKLTATKAAFVAPRDALESSLAALWEEVLNVRPIGIYDSFFDLGGHSLLAVRLMPKIQKQLGCNLPLSALLEGATIEQLAVRVREETKEKAWSPLIRLQAGTAARSPFFCVNPAGGEGLGYYELARCLGAAQPFYALQAPGLYADQTPYTDLPALATYFLTALRTVQPQGPYYLGGHSFGGPVAFEMACQLQQQGETVALLALFDSAAPVIGNRTIKVERDLTDTVSWLIDAGRLLARFYQKEFTLAPATLAALAPAEQLPYFLQQIKAEGLVPADTDQAFVRGLITVNQAASQSIVRYVEQVQPYAGDVVLFRALQLTDEDFRAWTRTLQDDPTLGWCGLVTGAIQGEDVPGDHISMLTSPYVATLAERLRKYLG